MRDEPREWQALRAAAVAGRDEWCLLSSGKMPIEIHATDQPGAPTVCVTKQLVAHELLRVVGKRRPISVVVCPGIPARRHCSIIRHVASEGDGVLSFLGDLDPLDLATFVCLRLGGDDLQAHPTTRVRAHWAGVCGDWLKESLGHLRRGHPVPGPMGTGAFEQPMSAFERRATRLLMRVAPELARELDATALDVLRRGHKIELEALLNDALYVPSHRRARVVSLVHRLFRGSSCREWGVTGRAGTAVRLGAKTEG